MLHMQECHLLQKYKITEREAPFLNCYSNKKERKKKETKTTEPLESMGPINSNQSKWAKAGLGRNVDQESYFYECYVYE